MNKRSFVLASIVTLIPFLSHSAELSLPAAPSAVAVPAAAPAADDVGALTAEYEEFYSALKVYSNVAFVSTPGSPEYVEASASGQYLRARLEGMASRIRRATGAEPRVSAALARSRGVVSFKVLSELNDVFGFYSVPAGWNPETRGVPVKAGYCQINYVKNNVPFLVQYDGFLKKGEVILTFDDGPGPLTEEVSASMKEGRAPSLFFVLGRSLGDAGKARIKAEAADGHSVGVHGYGHATDTDKPFTNYSTEKIISQLGGVSRTIADATGAKPGFFRPPYGIISADSLKAVYSDLNLVPVGWTIDTLDWSTKDPDELYQKTIATIKQRGKGIVLMHDIHPQSRTAAKRLVKWLAENGFKVVSPERLAQAYKAE